MPPAPSASIAAIVSAPGACAGTLNGSSGTMSSAPASIVHDTIASGETPGSRCLVIIPAIAYPRLAKRIPAPPMAMVVVTIDAGPKPIGSREAMRRTIATSPFYPAWVTSTTETVTEVLAACAAGDFPRIGELTESNALRMHATIEGAFPPIRYLTARSVAVFDAVAELRAAGVPGVTVCSSSDEVPEVAARADLVVDGPAGVVALFSALAAAIGTP